jgi:hypothetical protein
MIFGRKKIVAKILKILKLKSIVFVAERRVGKTEVLKLIQKEASKSDLIIYLDVEDVNTPIGFVEKIIDKVTAKLNRFGKAKRTIWLEGVKNLIPQKVKGVEFKESKGKDWKKLLKRTINEICDDIEGKFIILFDEIPYMLQKISNQENLSGNKENNTLEILDTLRSLRQSQSKLRMVYTGSIGLHHVIKDIRGTLSSEPTNDMETVELLPLSNSSALEMAQYQVKFEEILIELKELKNLIQQCDRVPFYIEKAIKRLALLEVAITQDTINQEINVIITDANDELEMSHYKTRLKDYYLGIKRLNNGSEIQHAIIAQNILSNLASTTESQSIDDCYRQIKLQLVIDDRELIIELLDNLAKDYYIKADTDKNYQFCFSLIKRWWQKYHSLTVE